MSYLQRALTRRRLIVMLAAVAVLLVAALAVTPGLIAQAAPTGGTFTVNSTTDAPDASPNNGVCSTSTPGQCTLRAAIEEANAQGGISTINLPAGTYNLTIDELTPGDSAGDNISIVGQGTPANTTIVAKSGSRVFDVDPNLAGVTFSVSNVTIEGGTGGYFGGGGAMLAGGGAIATPDTVTISNCVLDSNTAGNLYTGGALMWIGSGTLTIQNSTFSNNTAPTGNGGGAFIDSNGEPLVVSMSGTTFSGNSAGPASGANQGGGLFLTIGSNTATLTNVTFTNNQARTLDVGNIGQGGGVYLGAGTLNVNTPNFTGNAATVNGGGTGLGGAFYATSGTLNVTNGTLNGAGGTGELFALNSTASATVRGATIQNATTVFNNLGSATLRAYANNITSFTTAFTGSGTPAIGHNYWGTNDPLATAPSGMPVPDEWLKRLGAPVSSWADDSSSPGSASLGNATLTGGSGGTRIVVSHGRGISNVPFGNGIAPYANQTCSDYYDFFTLSGSGSYTVRVPVDGSPASCLSTTLSQMKVYRVTNLATCSSLTPDTQCWNPILSGTSVNGQAIQITGLSNADLGGTPMVAGDPAGLDPTAVTLVNFGAAESAGTNLLWVALLALGLLIGLGTLRWSRRRSTRA